jgi:nucleoside-diphosphate-sugar epimerase
MKTLLIAGFGDIARRAAPQLARRFVLAPLSRRHGADLDRPETLSALAGADAVLHCAPPPARGAADPRTANLLASLETAGILPARFVYVSTSGVYGDCGGAHVDETRPVNPQTDRARRRVDAEAQLSRWCRARAIPLLVLRVPGIYAEDRLPLERLRAGTPVLRMEDDVYTNHVHAADLAAIVVRALEEDAPAGLYNASDDSEMRAGDWMDLVADRCGLPRPPRIARSEAAARLPAETRSFLGESRRLVNRRLKDQLGIRLRFPTVADGLPAARAAA